MRIGITEWNLKLGADPAAVILAAQLGFEGVQVSFRRKIVDDKIPVDNPEIIARYLQLSKANGIPFYAACAEKSHDSRLYGDNLATFFGRRALKTQSEVDYKAMLFTRLRRRP